MRARTRRAIGTKSKRARIMSTAPDAPLQATFLDRAIGAVSATLSALGAIWTLGLMVLVNIDVFMRWGFSAPLPAVPGICGPVDHRDRVPATGQCPTRGPVHQVRRLSETVGKPVPSVWGPSQALSST